MALIDSFGYVSCLDEVPAIPQAPRSARGKRTMRKKIEDSHLSAFDMLAVVAGKLLTEKECTIDYLRGGETGIGNTRLLCDNIKREQLIKERSFKMEDFDQHSPIGKMLGCKVISEKKASYDVKIPPFSTKANKLGSDSDIMEPNKSLLTSMAKESSDVYNKCETPVATEKWDTWNKSSGLGKSHKSKGDWNLANANKPKMYSIDDPMDLDTKPSGLLSSDTSAKVPFCRNNNQHTSCIRKYKDVMELVDKNDDERSFGCSHSSTLSYKDVKLQRISDNRIKKIVASKHWKVASNMLHDGDFSKCSRDYDLKPTVHGKKLCHTHLKTHRASFKRRKLFVNSSVSTSRERASSEALSDLHHNGSSMKIKRNNSHAYRVRMNGASSITSGHKISYKTPDYHVKLSIKSFKVPELFIEIPETATVASLKRTVMETVTAILGGGLCVDVLLEGKKVIDDNKTLRQAGIFNGDRLDNLGFTLEPNPIQASAPLTNNENPSCLGIADASEPQARISSNGHPSEELVATDSTQLALTYSCPESDDSSHSHAEKSVPDETTENSQALVAVLPVNDKPLAVVPMPTPKKTEVSQRRLRRPFTVAEVEALVHAVEKFGTGRWRDVKQCAFDNVKHRTYVDLKDKWKTLVHTARISPQQRRGEPVPQDLLDRVLLAHAYWSQHQAKPSKHADLPSLDQQPFQ